MLPRGATVSEKAREGIAEAAERAPAWLRRFGVYGWLLIGAVAFVGVILWLIAYTAGLTIPLVIAAVLGALFAPPVAWLERKGVPRAAGAGLVLIFLLGAIVASVWLTVNGVLQQGEEIVAQVGAGLDSLNAWLRSLDLPAGTASALLEEAGSVLQRAGGGVVSALTSGLSGTVALLFGSFVGGFLLFFLLKDWDSMADWLACNIGVPPKLGRQLVDDGISAMRQYYAGVTLSGFVVAVIVAIAMWALGLPLAFTIGLVTFLTCYIPYAGALIAGAFAVLVALGSGGLNQAVVVLVVVLVTQNVIQTVIQNQIASDKLNVHPLAAFIATILGATIVGLLGAMLAPALLALGLRARQRFVEWDAPAEPQTASS
jgi:putative heme transporter